MMRKTKYYITTRTNRKNFLLKYGDWMFKYVPESKTWEASDYWYEEIIMNASADFEEITEERAKECVCISANGTCRTATRITIAR